MTREEAIKRLKEARSTIQPFRYVDEAIDYAVKALEQENADTCCDCAFEDVEEWEMPCSKCKRGCNDYWRPKKEN